jgi:hypothetical protein
MTCIARYGAAALVAAGFAVALLSGGCAASTPQAVQQPAATAAAGAQIPRMTAQEKRSMIASSFPVEVPVLRGRVVRGQAQGGDAWDYQLEVAAPAADVAEWYATWYTKADWQLVGDEAAGKGRKLTLVKGRAESMVVVTPLGADLANVSVVLGVGAPVLNTQ